MKAYGSYIAQLDGLVTDAQGSPTSPIVHERIVSALDGQAASELRRLVPLETLRANGIFFTASRLAQRAVRNLLPTLDQRSKILDPACGAADLLLAIATGLKAGRNLRTTIQQWESSLFGRELHPEPVAAAKRRLWLAAWNRTPRHRSDSVPEIDSTFPNIRVGCGLEAGEVISNATHIVMNPPFTVVKGPTLSWTSGKVNQAALFLASCLERANTGTRIVAILPEVLRGGSRYRRWRDFVSERARIERLESVGRFDSATDVDVFILELRIQERSLQRSAEDWNLYPEAAVARVGDRFNARIGPVVDYRAPHLGRWHPYIHARQAPAWGTLKCIEKHRRFEGSLVPTPFVAVRRTSRPGDPHRAIGTLILEPRDVAVENHLICLTPKSGNINACHELLTVLRDPKTTEWLDHRIRCRHLTVSSLMELPWWPMEP